MWYLAVHSSSRRVISSLSFRRGFSLLSRLNPSDIKEATKVSSVEHLRKEWKTKIQTHKQEGTQKATEGEQEIIHSTFKPHEKISHPGVHVLLDANATDYIQKRFRNLLLSGFASSSAIVLAKMFFPLLDWFTTILLFSSSAVIHGILILSVSKIISRLVLDANYGRVSIYNYNLLTGRRKMQPTVFSVDDIKKVVETNSGIQITIKKGYPVEKWIPYFLMNFRYETDETALQETRTDNFLMASDFTIVDPGRVFGANSSQSIKKRELLHDLSINNSIIPQKNIYQNLPIVSLNRHGLLESHKEEQKVAALLLAWKEQKC